MRFKFKIQKGQASLEYMVMLGLSLGVFAAILYFSSTLIASTSAQIGVDSAFRAVNHMQESSDFIYIHGYPSKTQINVYIPPSVEDVTIFNNNSINVRVGVGEYYTDVHGVTRGLVQGDLSDISTEGNFVLDIYAHDNEWVNITVI
ncbi:MAG: hypothetical protein GF334_01210 [Candidatus Altiarchaeales archaeon]|nr:hypothetical protein [Candidatus Altiarchaeales archaeon]